MLRYDVLWYMFDRGLNQYFNLCICWHYEIKEVAKDCCKKKFEGG